MAQRITYNIITGTDPRLGFTLYYSPHFGQNIWRRKSSLTGARTKREAAFKGFRKSSSRLKEASPIAASLYKQVPAAIKQYALFRTLTGEAIRMLKEGMEATIITETLKRKYIDLIPDIPDENTASKTASETPEGDRVKGMKSVISYPAIPSEVRKITGRRRSHLLQKITAGQSGEYFASNTSNTLVQDNSNTSESLFTKPVFVKRRNKTTSGLIYLGRLPECKHFKIWVKPSDPSVFGSIYISDLFQPSHT